MRAATGLAVRRRRLAVDDGDGGKNGIESEVVVIDILAMKEEDDVVFGRLPFDI